MRGEWGFVNVIRASRPQVTLPQSLLAAALVGALLGRLGPFDTFSDLAAPQRYAYWIGLVLLMWLQIWAALRLIGERLPWLPRALAGAALGAVPTAFEVAWAESALRVERDLGLLDIAALWGDVLLIAAPLTLLFEWANLRAPPVAPAAGQPTSAAEAPPSDWRHGVIALAAEDHYLRIYREGGDTLVLKRFTDALQEMQALDGVRVHRSWWVARAAVVRSEQDGQRVTLVLRSGLAVPVSRTYLLQARQAGLLG